MKRVLCILSCMNAGGAETFLMKIYRELDRTKYQMDFCVNIFEEGFYDKEITQMGGRLFRIPAKSDNLKEFKRQLSAIVKNEQYEAVLRITSSAMGFLDLKIAKKAGAKLCAARSSNSNDPAGIKAKVAHRLGRVLYGKYVDVKIAPSDLAAIYTFGEHAYKNGEVNILHNALDLDVYKFGLEERKRVRAEFGIKESEILCGHVGRFSPQKNHDFLIDIFSELCKEHSNYKLLLVGNGELEEKIRKKCADKGLRDKVIFAGVRSDIPAVLSAMDVFVFPSLYEGMPNTVIEAQATGLPCVISDTITKEAKITDLVRYTSLNNSVGSWALELLQQEFEKRNREQYNSVARKQGYDIKQCVSQFVETIFGTI